MVMASARVMTAAGVPATPAAAPPKATIVALPEKISPGSLLVLSSDQDGTFDLNPGGNDLTFPLPQKNQQVVKAIAVSPDGRSLVATIPPQAQSGEIAVKNKKTGQTYDLPLELRPGESSTNLYIYWVVFPLAFYLIIICVIYLFLKHGEISPGKKWTLHEALSEYIPIKKEVKDDQGNVLIKEVNELASSSSRLIAFMGFVSLIVWVVAVMLPFLYWFSRTGITPDLGNVSTFVLAQAGVFAPYLASKVAGAIGGK